MGALSLAALAAAGVSALAGMVHAKGRHVRIIGGLRLRQPAADGFGPLSRSLHYDDVKIDHVHHGQEDDTDKEEAGGVVDGGPPTLSASRPSSMESER